MLLVFLHFHQGGNVGYFSNKNSIGEHQQDAIISTAAQNNIAKLLADIVRNRLHAVKLLEITSKDPAVISSATITTS
jgi:hypothetical protein